MQDFWIAFALAVLATWRVTHLLSSEDGPGDLIVRMRARLGKNRAGELMDCFYCLSIWIAVPGAFFVSIAQWIARSDGRIRADVVHDKLGAMGYTGSERTTRRAVAAAMG